MPQIGGGGGGFDPSSIDWKAVRHFQQVLANPNQAVH